MTEAVSPAQWNGQPAVRPEINAMPAPLSRALAVTPYLFGGEHGVMTDPTGLVHMRARYYHPGLRRFVNPDPIGFAGGMNGYGYAAGSPVMMVDPSGFATAQDHFELYDWAGIFGGGTSNDFVMPQQSDVAQMQAYEAEIRREQTAQKMIDFAITAVDLAMLAAAVAEPSPGGEVAYAGLRGPLRASAAKTPLTPLTPNPYAGVQEASAYLKAQGVPRDARVQILQSFDVRTIQVRQAGGAEFGLRYFDGVNTQAKGRYLFETFPASRASLALDPKWNGMTNFTQWQVRPGATLLESVASPQGVGLPGGQIQKFVPNLNDLLAP